MVQDPDQGAAAMESSAPGKDADAPVAAEAGPAMTVAGILTVASILLAFAVFALGLVLVQYCFFNPRDGRRRTSSPSSVRGARGVDPEVLRSLPVKVYRTAKGSQEEGLECAVCLAGVKDGEAARFLPRCGHGFHAECVDLWLASHSTCPLCRLAVGKPDVSPPLPALPAVPPERRPASFAVNMNLPASVLLGASESDQGALTAAPLATGGARQSPAAASAITIEIPESSAPAAATPRDAAAKSPGTARLKSLRRLWSFGRQAPLGGTTSCSCSGEGAGSEQGISLAVGVRPVQAPPQPEAAAGSTARTTLYMHS